MNLSIKIFAIFMLLFSSLSFAAPRQTVLIGENSTFRVSFDCHLYGQKCFRDYNGIRYTFVYWYGVGTQAGTTGTFVTKLDCRNGMLAEDKNNFSKPKKNSMFEQILQAGCRL